MNMSSNQILEFIRNGGETRRFHTFPVLREQRVDSHSWQVAMLLWHVFGDTEPGVSFELMMAAMTHDLAEHKVGDIPSPAKRWFDSNYSLVEIEDGKPTAFRDGWNRMEAEVRNSAQQNWEQFLNDEQKDQLKFCDVAEGALYCIRERAMGNKLIAECFRNFLIYMREILERYKTFTTKINVEWREAFNLCEYIEREWVNVHRQ